MFLIVNFVVQIFGCWVLDFRRMILHLGLQILDVAFRSSNLQQVWEFGFWISYFGLWLFDFWIFGLQIFALDFLFGFLILDFGFQTLDFGLPTLDFAFLSFEFGWRWITKQDFGCWILDSVFGLRILGFAYQIWEFGFWVSDFGFQIWMLGFRIRILDIFCSLQKGSRVDFGLA